MYRTIIFTVILMPFFVLSTRAVAFALEGSGAVSVDEPTSVETEDHANQDAAPGDDSCGAPNAGQRDSRFDELQACLKAKLCKLRYDITLSMCGSTRARLFACKLSCDIAHREATRDGNGGLVEEGRYQLCLKKCDKLAGGFLGGIACRKKAQEDYDACLARPNP